MSIPTDRDITKSINDSGYYINNSLRKSIENSSTSISLDNKVLSEIRSDNKAKKKKDKLDRILKALDNLDERLSSLEKLIKEKYNGRNKC